MARVIYQGSIYQTTVNYPDYPRDKYTQELEIAGKTYPVNQDDVRITVNDLGEHTIYFVAKDKSDPNKQYITQHDKITVIAKGTKTVTEQHLDAINKAIATYTGGVQSYSVAGRSITYHSLDDLFRLKKYYEDQLAREQGRTPVSLSRVIFRRR